MNKIMDNKPEEDETAWQKFVRENVPDFLYYREVYAFYQTWTDE